MSFGFGQSFASPRAPRRSRGFVPKPSGSTILGLGDSISDPTNSLLVGQFLGAHIPLLATLFGWTQVGAGRLLGVTGAGFAAAVPGAVTISGGAVTAVANTSGGSGYTNAAPTLTFTGGGTPTRGAQAFATISGGAVTGWNIADGGAGYTSAPTPVITYSNDPTRGGISGGVLSDYTSIPAVTGAQLLKGTNLASRMTNYAADVIVIGFGTNDWVASYTVGNQTIANPTTFHTDLLSVVTTAQAQANHPLVVLLGTEQLQQITGTLGLTGTPAYASSPTDAVRQWNDAIRQVAFERACPYVDLTAYNYSASVHASSANNVHPNAAGYLWMRDRIAAAIYGD